MTQSSWRSRTSPTLRGRRDRGARDDRPVHEDLVRSGRRRCWVIAVVGLGVLTATIAVVVLPGRLDPRRVVDAVRNRAGLRLGAVRMGGVGQSGARRDHGGRGVRLVAAARRVRGAPLRRSMARTRRRARRRRPRSPRRRSPAWSDSSSRSRSRPECARRASRRSSTTHRTASRSGAHQEPPGSSSPPDSSTRSPSASSRRCSPTSSGGSRSSRCRSTPSCTR